MDYYGNLMLGFCCGALMMGAVWMLVEAFRIQKSIRKGKE